MDEKKFQNISLDNFQQYLCVLNYYNDFEEEKFIINVRQETDENADKIEEKDIKINRDEDLCKVPNSFTDMKEYIKIWQSLFFLEAKAQIVKAKFLESEAAEQFFLSEAESKSNFSFLKFSSTGSIKNYSYHDLVVISPHTDLNYVKDEHLIGLVESNDGNYLKIRVVIKIRKEEDFEEAYLRYTKLYPHFSKDKAWFVQKICNIVTLDREYQALHSINDIYFKDILLNPDQNQNFKEYFSIPEKLEEKLKSIYNESQIAAIKETLKKEGITLIQGPPGTGKTTTVLGTISVLINSTNEAPKKKEEEGMKKKINGKMEIENENNNNFKKLRPWIYEPNFKDWRDEFEEDKDIFRKSNFYLEASITDRVVIMHSSKSKKTAPPEKILICAPSNAAIDEIVRKILEKGLLDQHGNRIDPFLVRIGPNVDRSLESVSLDYLTEKEVQSRDMKQDEINNIRNEAKIVCGTLSSAGSQIILANPQNFDTVIVDEAAQGIEVSTLIPLKYGCKRLILIGDPQQLPATIFSKKCEKFGYDLSLFERLQRANYPVFLLKIQYRMHPNISKYISETFYKSEIKDATQIMDLIGEQEFYKHPGFQPFIFFHVEGIENFVKNSYRNNLEAHFIVSLYSLLKTRFPNFTTSQLGIISPYSQQVQAIKSEISRFEETLQSNVEVNTVDGFQGREKDIIIFSTVRSKTEPPTVPQKTSIGFLNDRRRMNVSLSRARVALIVVGNAKRLMIKGIWKKLVQFAVNEGCCYRVEGKIEDFWKDMGGEEGRVLKLEELKGRKKGK